MCLFPFHFWPFTGVLQEIRREVTRSREGKSLLPAVIHYGAWRKGDTYVFNHRLGAPRMHPEANRKVFA
jgi:hypothetical protein